MRDSCDLAVVTPRQTCADPRQGIPADRLHRAGPVALKAKGTLTNETGPVSVTDGCEHRDVEYLHVYAAGDDLVAEQQAIELVKVVSHVLAISGFGPKETPDVHIEGPHFVYENEPTLFSYRGGYGPLNIAWDTNLLIDYFNHGAALWRGEELVGSEPTHSEQLEALQVIMALWVLRDIRMAILPGTVVDSRKAQVPADRQRRRSQALHQFFAAIDVIAGDSTPILPPLLLPANHLDEATLVVPEGGDRHLVRAAVRGGAHVFLTCDRKVLAAASALRPFGLLITSPQDLLEPLAASGALFCLTDPNRHLHWPIPDLQRVTKLMAAIGADMPPGAR